MVPESVCENNRAGAIRQRRTKAILSKGKKRRGGASGRYIIPEIYQHLAGLGGFFCGRAVEKLVLGQLVAQAEKQSSFARPDSRGRLSPHKQLRPLRHSRNLLAFGNQRGGG